jgi:hypothetical protein
VQGLGEFGTGVGKGIPNSAIDLLNTGPTIVNGYGYIIDAVTGQPIVQRLTPIPYPDATTPIGPMQEVGNVVGSVVTTGVVLGGIGAALEGGKLPIATDGAGATFQAPKTIPYEPNGSVVLQGNAPVCGPACAAMTITDKTGTSVSLENAIGNFPNGVRSTGVSTTELSDAISSAGVKNTVDTTMLPGELNRALDGGNTVIVNVYGHFIIVDGTKTVNGVTYYMTRDPFTGPRGVAAPILNNAISRGANAIVIGK